MGLPLGTRADRADALLAAGVTTIGLISLAPVAAGGPGDPDDLGLPLAVAVMLLLCVPLAFRRRAPRLVVTTVAAGVAVMWVTDLRDTATAIAGSIALYSVGRHVERPRSLRAFAAVGGALGLLAAWTALSSDDPVAGAEFFGRIGVIVGAFWLGDSQRTRLALIDVLREQARLAEAEHRDAERRAVLEERARISRELHDVVAHSLSVMVIQAVAASRLVERDRERASVALEHVAEVGRSALTEMRGVLGRLHDDDVTPDYAPLPTLADLDALIERCRAAGLSVTMDRETLPPLTAGTELSVVRIVQEALTNVMKHSPRSHARVRLQGGGPDDGTSAVVVEVVDDGAGRDGAAPVGGAGSDGRGRGLIGLRERVEGLGGTFRAGPASGGGFSVHAVVPAGGRP